MTVAKGVTVPSASIVIGMSPEAAAVARTVCGGGPAGAPVRAESTVEGAMFSFGDGHARQGEGETCGVAVECAMDSVVIVDLIKGVPTPWPRLESDAEIMTTGSSRPLEDAFRISHQQMTRWVAELTGMSELDSYQLVSQAALSPVANVVDTVYTMVCKLPKSLLGGVAPMQGVHAKLRRQAAHWGGAA